MKRNLLLLLIIVVTTLTSSCNFDLTPSTVTHNISESKQKGFFKDEYYVDSLKVFDKRKPFIIESVWIEKGHTSTFDFWGNEAHRSIKTSFQIVFNMDDDSYFKNGDFLNTWVMYDAKHHPYGLDENMINIILPGRSIPAIIKFYVFRLKDAKPNYHQTDTVAEFVLKKL